jgi:hypothetical protein
MAPLESESPVVAQLAERLRDALVRLEGLASKIDQQYLSKELWKADSARLDEVVRSIRQSITNVEQIEATHATKEELAQVRLNVAELQDDKKWLVRLVIGLIVVGVISGFIASGGFSK